MEHLANIHIMLTYTNKVSINFKWFSLKCINSCYKIHSMYIFWNQATKEGNRVYSIQQYTVCIQFVYSIQFVYCKLYNSIQFEPNHLMDFEVKHEIITSISLVSPSIHLSVYTIKHLVAIIAQSIAIYFFFIDQIIM